ncbi:NfeD family protein [Acuticoccus sp.]|uniref:NfeD family protein n=1 Tax=Acuticoccus sp. TaxID=1904378 RepID=UPI003B52A587
MMLVLAVLRDLGPYAWFIVGALFFIAEVVLPGVNLIWFGLAASLTGTVGLAGPALLGEAVGWEMQMVSFIAFAAVAVLAARLVVGRRPDDGADRVNRSPTAYIGREVILAEPIVGGTGRVTWGDSLWRVAGPDLPAGTRVRVVGVEAATLAVEPVAVSAEATNAVAG